MIFSTSTSEFSRQCALTINGERVRTSRSCKFLGVLYDGGLHFHLHARTVADRVNRRLGALRALAGKDWGMAQKDLHKVYQLFAEPIITYAAPAWMPWLSSTSLSRLERCQKAAARIICGLPQNTADDAVWPESNIIPAKRLGQVLSAMAFEHARRMPEDAPINCLAAKQVANRFKKARGWREEARQLSRGILGDDMQVISLPVVRWRPGGARIVTSVDALSSTKASLPEEQIVTEAADKVRGVADHTDVQVYTDGSVNTEEQKSGYGYAVWEGNNLIHEGYGPVTAECISYEAELKALEQAVTWLQCWLPSQSRKVAIFTDSMSAVMALRSATNYNDAMLNEVIRRLSVLADSHEVGVHWIPGHVGVEGNERADRLASVGSQEDQHKVRTWQTARRLLRQGLTTPIPSRGRYKVIYAGGIKYHDGPRCEQVLLNQLRAGFCTGTGYYRSRLTGEATACSKCGEIEETADHWWDCPVVTNTRRLLFNQLNLAEALKQPEMVLRLVKRHWPEWLPNA